MHQELLHLTCLAKITVNDSTTLKDSILQSGHVSAQVFTEGYKRKLQQRTVTWITEHDKHVLQDNAGFNFYCFLNRPTLD